MSKKDDYEVGYGRPPVEHQFRKGVSGNPNGRRRKAGGSKSKERESARRFLALVIDEEMRRTITIAENGRPKKISMFEAVVRQTINDALKGCAKSRALLLRYAALVGQQLPDPSDNIIKVINAFQYDADDDEPPPDLEWPPKEENGDGPAGEGQ